MSASFSAEGSRDPDGDSVYYTWDFGDGEKLTTTYDRQIHGYVDNGTYTVLLTVTDIHGATATADAQVSISNAAPVILSATITTPRMPAPIPMTASVHLNVFDQGADDHPTAAIDWGDGTISHDTVHAYTVAGVLLPRVTVTDKDGASVSQDFVALWLYDGAAPHPTAPGYEALDLGTLGGSVTIAASINNHDEVVGSSVNADMQQHAFLWKDGLMRDLGPSQVNERWAYGAANKINDAGWILGWASHASPSGLAIWRNGTLANFVQLCCSDDGGAQGVAVSDAGEVLLNHWGHESPRAALWKNGDLKYLAGLAAGGYSFATAMNTGGQIVGASAYRHGPDSPGSLYHAFVWDNDVMKDLGDFGTPCRSDPTQQCGSSEANDINDAGQIVGYATNATTSRAVLWQPGDTVPLDLGFGTGSSNAVAINARGQIAGSGGGEGYFRDGESVVRLGSLGGGQTTVAGMNDQGVVVGSSKTATGEIHAFVWRRETGMVDLGAGPYASTDVGSTAVAINEQGDVIGNAMPCPAKWGGACSGWITTRAIIWRNTQATASRVP